MRSKALLSKSVQLKTRTIGRALPVRVADLDGCELHSHCDRCGRQFQLYPGHADFDSRTHLVTLLARLACSAQHSGRACGGFPRRLILVRDERRWALDTSGEWLEDDFAYWEPADFEALAVVAKQVVQSVSWSSSHDSGMRPMVVVPV